MAPKSDKLFLWLCLLFTAFLYSQEYENPTHPKFKDFKSDSTFKNFWKLREPVAQAQIVALKGGALLVRLKTNATTINRLKTAGNMDLATQVERETFLTNKQIVKAYRKNFNFCPVYFFTADCSDSVKHQRTTGIFLDSNLVRDPSIVCEASFYLVAEQGNVYDSSLGLVPESQAAFAAEHGTPGIECSIIVKNRFFIQLNKPFPYYFHGSNMKYFANHVKSFNNDLLKFYDKSKTVEISPEISKYVY